MAISKIKARRNMLQEIEVADKTTSLQYGPPAGDSGLIFVYMCEYGLPDGEYRLPLVHCF